MKESYENLEKEFKARQKETNAQHLAKIREM